MDRKRRYVDRDVMRRKTRSTEDFDEDEDLFDDWDSGDDDLDDDFCYEDRMWN